MIEVFDDFDHLRKDQRRCCRADVATSDRSADLVTGSTMSDNLVEDQVPGLEEKQVSIVL